MVTSSRVDALHSWTETATSMACSALVLISAVEPVPGVPRRTGPAVERSRHVDTRYHRVSGAGWRSQGTFIYINLASWGTWSCCPALVAEAREASAGLKNKDIFDEEEGKK